MPLTFRPARTYMRDGSMMRGLSTQMMRFLFRSRPLVLALLLAVCGALVVADSAEARRAGSFGSFGSRGARTYQAPAPTPSAPGAAQPIQRSMTPRPAQTPAAGAAAAAQQARRPGLFGGGFLGSMLGGLALGGLIGMLFGGGFGALGGFGGMLGGLLQIALIAGGVMLLMRFLKGRQQQAPAYAGAGDRSAYGYRDAQPTGTRPSGIPSIGGGLFGGGSASPSADPHANARGADGRWPGDELGLGDDDLAAFERLLVEIQQGYGAEDFAALRARTTPEVMGYLAEELGENATKGVKNEVSDVRLVEGDVAEAWREADAEYATVSLHYESRDVTRDRATGRIVDGSEEPTETHEVWTFVRRGGEDWKLAAIQAA